uniref:Uncharacterized protein n=1 Tax=Strombidium inclinatum TaxID=197538 RepID=A0A7S3IP69_9SPIT|mmetsp:Transcript_31644/g.48400  ORF Transcript_31644/g.48400 Transcript_31644/m.48400 type:complete len:128 (+) Transcript_31644:247-630(+)|eukprot:CAMPEP_0170494788 /NCGR_PEP_ID=MMETSP0208-20121228/14839_1 /TAXON_ID=197538 /ORGANISM="Strombidium inclinatum, Strain S3" /LENGTH=127 /DNA_ID=CAMNT_0010770887 /DNA_START=247 /DNA_END=630 /DNA_ORIENTATION=-
MIKEMKNPLHDVTWNCKNNYNVYTTDYDPKHSHFDRISGDVMEVQRIYNQIQKLENKSKQPWSWQEDERETDGQVLRQLKKELGLPEDKPLGSAGNLNVREAIETAVAEHASRERSPGYIKAQGLDN